MVFAGRFNDETKLAGVGLGCTMNHMLGLCIIYGLSNALDTLISQAYGAGNLTLCGVYINRARVITSIVFIPVTLALMSTKPILLFLGQEPATVDVASTYTKSMIPAIYLLNLVNIQEKLLNFM